MFFRSNDLYLFGVLYSPTSGSCLNKGYLIIHPITEEKKSSHRTLVDIAMELSRKGFFVFMFDLRGCADSQGEFKETSITTWIADISNAIKVFKEESLISEISIIGLRFGAYLTMIYNYLNAEIADLILVEPIFYPYNFLQKTLKQKYIREYCTSGEVTSSKTDILEQLKNNSIDIDGYEMTSSFYNDVIFYHKTYDPAMLIHDVKGLLISINITGKIPKKTDEILKYDNKLLHKTLKIDPFWDKIDGSNTSDLVREISNYCIKNNEK